MEDKFEVTNKAGRSIPRIPFADIKNDILGKSYNLSLAFVSPKEAKSINKKYRKKNKPTNVLSFCLSEKEGELILCPELVKKESQDKNKNFGKNYRQLFEFLVIHGMLHLDGMQHGSIMEKAEKFYCQKYDQKYFNRDRRGVAVDQNSRGRIRQRRKTS